MLKPAMQYANGDANLNPSQLAGACVAKPVLVDEFAPYQWTGANAAMRYGSALKNWAKSLKLASLRVTTQVPTNFDVTGGSAWVVVPATFTYLANGKPSVERGVYTFVLVRMGAIWKVQAAAWATTYTS